MAQILLGVAQGLKPLGLRLRDLRIGRLAVGDIGAAGIEIPAQHQERTSLVVATREAADIAVLVAAHFERDRRIEPRIGLLDETFRRFDIGFARLDGGILRLEPRQLGVDIAGNRGRRDRRVLERRRRRADDAEIARLGVFEHAARLVARRDREVETALRLRHIGGAAGAAGAALLHARQQILMRLDVVLRELEDFPEAHDVEMRFDRVEPGIFGVLADAICRGFGAAALVIDLARDRATVIKLFRQHRAQLAAHVLAVRARGQNVLGVFGTDRAAHVQLREIEAFGPPHLRIDQLTIVDHGLDPRAGRDRRSNRVAQALRVSRCNGQQSRHRHAARNSQPPTKHLSASAEAGLVIPRPQNQNAFINQG